MSYALIKTSDPGWVFATEDKLHLLWILEHSVCRACRDTKEDLDKQEDVDGVDYFFAFPSDYDTMNLTDKIHTLLGTGCGAEYRLQEISEDDIVLIWETAYTSVEVKEAPYEIAYFKDEE